MAPLVPRERASVNGGPDPGRRAAPGVVLRRVRLPGATALRSAREVIVDREVIVVEVDDGDGNRGWGECPALPRPGYSAEYLDGAWAVLRDVLVPLALDDPAAALSSLDAVPGHQMARAGLVGALIDLDQRAAGRSLGEALAGGAAVADRVASNAVIGIHDTPDELLAAVADARARGHRSVTLKIAPGDDRVPVRIVRDAWPDLVLSVDANGSYPDADVATRALGAVESAAGELAYIEQPLGVDDLVGTAVLARRLASPIALDESVGSVGDAVTALSLGAMDVLNLKPARLGGPVAALAAARTVVAAGKRVFCGGMVESGIGRAAALALAAQPECTLATDLGPSTRYHRRDLTAPFELDDGFLVVPTGPGIGVEPDRDALADCTVTTWRSR